MPTSRRTLGDFAERVAVRHLESRGYSIRERNVRTRYGEIDIVAQKADLLAFVEVRCRRGSSMGSAVQSLSPQKQRRLASLAEDYGQNRTDLPEQWRIDLIALDLAANGKLVSLQHIEGAVEG
jgi:putative endonuclease